MNDIEKKLEALKVEFLEKLEALQKEAEMQKEQEEWKPGAGEKYFFVNNDFCAYSFCNFNDEVDSYNFEIGNCFRTETRAEQVAEKMRQLLRLEQLHDMLCPAYVPDWESDEAKFYVYFSHIQNNWKVSFSTAWWYPCMVAFDTKKNALKAAEILNKELEESE